MHLIRYGLAFALAAALIPALPSEAEGACCGERSGAAAVRAKIAFVVNRDGWGEIWIMDDDGRNRRRLTGRAPKGSDAAGSSEPAWSPRGRRIAFISTGRRMREDQRDDELYVMRPDGSGKRRLTRNRQPEGSPTWSPDGKRIAFVRFSNWNSDRLSASIYVMRRDGSGLRRLTRAGPGTLDLSADWSPDGSRIAFTRATHGRPTAIYTVSRHGRDKKLLAQRAWGPAWSPDGTKIAFVSDRDQNGETCYHECSSSREVYVMDAVGSDQRRLTTTPADDAEPAWAPDGSKIVFTSDRDAPPEEHSIELHVMNADGSCVTQLTRGAAWSMAPAWQPVPRFSPGPVLVCP